MSKRSGVQGLLKIQEGENKRAKTHAAEVRPAHAQAVNPYLQHPVNPEQALFFFLQQVRNVALKHAPKGQSGPIQTVSKHRGTPSIQQPKFGSRDRILSQV